MHFRFTAAARRGLLIASAAAIGIAAGAAEYKAEVAEALNMRLVGYNDLQARSAYQPVIHEQGGRQIAYVGHHGGAKLNPLTGRQEANGTSIVDVTDPAKPRYLAHVEGEKGQGEQGGAQMVRICNGSELPKGDKRKVYMLRTLGNSAHEVWDVTTPEKPAMVTTIVSGLHGTHKNWWECDTGIAYLVSGLKDWRTHRMTQVYDLSDPAKPVFVRNFGRPGDEPGATGDVPMMLHGPISTGPKGNRVFFGYGTSKSGALQIVDRQKLLSGPKEATPANFRHPLVSELLLPGFAGAHTTLPLLGIEVPEFAKDRDGHKRDFVVIVNEQIRNECQEPRQMVFFADVTTETRPFTVSNYNVPEMPGNFCARGGRFGAHASNEYIHPAYDKRVVFFSWFNAGVRAVDVRDPYNPKEIAYYIPAINDATDKRCVKDGSGQRCKRAIQTNNVEVDSRGLIYIVDRADTGMHVLELTGPARAVANFK